MDKESWKTVDEHDNIDTGLGNFIGITCYEGNAGNLDAPGEGSAVAGKPGI